MTNKRVPLPAKMRVGVIAILMVAALGCAGTFLYAARIPGSRRAQVFVGGMGASWLTLVAGVRLRG
jgi:hypothetical protein